MPNFGRVIEVMTSNMSFSNDKFTIEGTIPFDNDLLPNESEIKLWNLSMDTINKIKKQATLMVNAGYRGDVGLVLHGFISKVRTKPEGVNRVTTIYVMDSVDLSKAKIKDITYAKGTAASYIIKDMAKRLGLPIAQFELNKDVRYVDGFTAQGEGVDIIQSVAKDCGTSAFINKGRLYVRSLRRGADGLFRLSPETGLIGSPEYFEDDTTKGFSITSQLQHRITTASAIQLKCSQFDGIVHVRSGAHHLSITGDFTTEVEAIL
ncbi:hypothetical protein BVG16_13795 [Paenibacillus selenitireducens]|uniref:Uncharacterized protein n=1 Tax=Paenibacillus selenitireducens TaxID=1324314 RepID=A0A1T2XCF3_9BACL|nr:hypothetical protein [Paenibacillus selenitireducens]OPA77520.1 hypothetical protein BVG16_13795 [Paenibacillus selenitireducens]